VRGAQELRVKESDRLAAMAEGLSRLGVENRLLEDGLWIRGGTGLEGGCIESRGDHRIAMAFAIAALAARAPIEIRDVANVATSFPGFLELARAAGLGVEAA
jgi:3-phosphoshikimate 1-carboxyvinyltransferase